MRSALLAWIAAAVALAQNVSGPRIVVESVPPYGVLGALTGRVEGLPPGTNVMFVGYFLPDAGWFSSCLIPPALEPSMRFNFTVAPSSLPPTKIALAVLPGLAGFPCVSGAESLPNAVLAAPVKYVIERLNPATRYLNFSGRRWRVKASGTFPTGPGPNFFSDSTDNAFIDAAGRLHLKISPCAKGWCSSEVILDESLGYGNYAFHVDTPLNALHPKAVAGFFTWSEDATQAHREIDIELSRWNNTVPTNAQFVVQPFSSPGHMLRFDVPATSAPTSYSFDWAPQSVLFQGGPAGAQQSWPFALAGAIPRPGDERVRINLYWHQGSAGGVAQEIVVNRFEFVSSTRLTAGAAGLSLSGLPSSGLLNGRVYVEQPGPWTIGPYPVWVQPFPSSGAAGRTEVSWAVHPNWRPATRTATVTAGTTAVALEQLGNTGTEEERMVGMLYYNYFARVGAPDEVDFQITEGLHKGLSVPTLAERFLNSAEFNENGRFGAGLYIGVLDRDPDYAGWRFVTRALASGFFTQSEILANFLNSPEFTSKHPGLPDAEFIRLMYRQILGREASPGEVTFHLAPLASMGRVEWTAVLLRSPEFRLGTNTRLNAFFLYALLLNREGTQAERNFWADALRMGMLLNTAISIVTGSPEFSLGYR